VKVTASTAAARRFAADGPSPPLPPLPPRPMPPPPSAAPRAGDPPAGAPHGGESGTRTGDGPGGVELVELAPDGGVSPGKADVRSVKSDSDAALTRGDGGTDGRAERPGEGGGSTS